MIKHITRPVEKTLDVCFNCGHFNRMYSQCRKYNQSNKSPTSTCAEFIRKECKSCSYRVKGTNECLLLRKDVDPNHDECAVYIINPNYK